LFFSFFFFQFFFLLLFRDEKELTPKKGNMDLESEDDDDDKEEEETDDACAEKRRRMFTAICFEIEDDEEERKTRNRRRRRLGEDKDEEVFELKWKRRQLKAHEWRIVRDERGARLEEEEEGDKDKMEIKTYFDILVSFLATSGDESLLLRKMWKRVRGNENVLEFVRGMKIKAKDADVLMSAPCRFPFLNDDDDDENDGECGFDRYSYDRCRINDESLRENFQTNGYLIAADRSESRVSKTLVDSFRTKTNERIEAILNAMRKNHSHVNVGTDVFAYKEIGSRGKYRFDALFDKEREEEDALFRFAKSEAPWVHPVKEILRDDEDIDINISIVWTEPNCLDQEWHCDGAHRGDQETYDEQTGALVKAHAKPYAVCVFMTLVDLDDTVGYTEFWPTSHKNAGLLGFGPAALSLGGVQSNQNAKAGDWVMYDYRLMHRGIGNKSKDVRRPILQFLYAIDGYKERKNYGTESVFTPSSGGDAK
jgi:ectoine hydroxylase-related dioxygenase (phytanoyl-CoA dioxygenase family)